MHVHIHVFTLTHTWAKIFYEALALGCSLLPPLSWPSSASRAPPCARPAWRSLRLRLAPVLPALHVEASLRMHRQHHRGQHVRVAEQSL